MKSATHRVALFLSNAVVRDGALAKLQTINW